MDRSAIFVDAGYVYASGGLLCANTKKRSMVGCDFEGFIDYLARFTEERSDLPLLRTYWYDASWGANPTFEQTLISELPSVKLRLGKLGSIGGRVVQKGVDALIVTDLMVLAQERAVSAAFLVTGDEDIRSGVKAAQALGVRVTLIGIEGRSEYEFTQAASLVSEADGNLMLDASVLRRFFSLRSPVPDEISTEDLSSEAGTDATPVVLGRAFGRLWSQNLTDTEARLLLARRVRIPHPVDALMMRTCRPLLPTRRYKRELRKGFWDGLDDGRA